MKVRMHRGGLRASMVTCEEIEPTIDALRAYLLRHHVLGGKVQVESYSDHPDTRINWKFTYGVNVDNSMFAYCDEMPS